MTKTNNSNVFYHLRIPFNSSFSKAEEEALWVLLRRGKFDDATFFVPHEESCSPGLGTIVECKKCVDRLQPIFKRLRKDGIDPSINVWWTQGFSDFSGVERDQRHEFDFRWAVRVDDYASHIIACPQDPLWLSHIQKMYRIFASLHPVRLWIDDDVRMTMRADMQSPCFCDVCLAEMEKRAGLSFSRKSLVSAIMADPPNEVRDAWLQFQDDLYHKIILGLTKAVHEISSQTHITSCHSGFEVQCAEGLRWERYIESLGSPKPYFRPGIGVYHDKPAPFLVNGLNHCRLAQSVLDDKVTLVPEIESYPHSRFNKSIRSVKANILLGQLMGISNISFNIYRCSGRLDLEIQHEDLWSPMLGDYKRCLQCISDLNIKKDEFEGISLYFHQEESHYVRGVGHKTKPIWLYRHRPFDNALPMLGFAVRYGKGKVIAFEGEHVCCLDEDERREIFSHGVLLDGRAAESLLLEGYGSLVGIVDQKKDIGGTREIISDSAFGVADEPINIRWEGRAKQFDWERGSRIVSVICEHDGKKTGHGLVLFENELGGRVAVLPYDSQAQPHSLGEHHQALCSPSFLAFSRQTQLKAVLEWLNRGPLPLFVPNAPSIYPLLIQQPDRLIASVTNFLPDLVENLTLELAEPDFNVGRLRQFNEESGSWDTINDAVFEYVDRKLLLRTSIAVGFLETAVLLIEPSK